MACFSLVGLFFLVFFNCARAESPSYGAPGKSVTLSPPPGAASPITSVLWRYHDDYAVEWSTGEAVTRYRNFKERTELDTTTGRFTINNLTQLEVGPYSVEINGVRLPDKYTVEMIEIPPKPKVWPRPDTDTVELVCQGDVTNAGPVSYWWNLGESGSFVEKPKTVVLPINDTTKLKETFSCRISNPVGEATSDPQKNPIFSSGEGAGGGGGLEGLAALPVLLLLAIAGFFAWKNRAAIQRRVCGNGNVNPEPSTEQPLQDKNTPNSSRAP